MACLYTEDCPDPVWKGGLCKYHYGRRAYLKRIGKTEDEAMSWRWHEPLADRLWAEVTKPEDEDSDDCWTWTGRRAGQMRYGQIWENGHYYYVHRVAYELLVGPIPEDLDLDHECHNRAAEAGLCDGGPDCPHHVCVRPSHMKPKTRGDNLNASPIFRRSVRKKKDDV